jgi:hypothetical protein
MGGISMGFLERLDKEILENAVLQASLLSDDSVILSAASINNMGDDQ